MSTAKADLNGRDDKEILASLRNGLIKLSEENIELSKQNTKLTQDNAKILYDMKELDQKIKQLQIIINSERNIQNQNKSLEERVETLEELSKLNSVRSCYEYYQRGVKTSGTYTIDPDGPMVGAPAIEVYCNFQTGTTEVLHNHDQEEVNIEHCLGTMCYYLSVDYTSASMAQIEALIQLSDTCKQEIKCVCFLAPLFVNGAPQAFWVNKNGKNESYFSGSDSSFHTCQCGINGDCEDSAEGQLCNCDANLPVFLEDDGFVTNEDSLPITGFYYDELKYESEIAIITIGRLICSGKQQFDDTTNSESCRNLKLGGEYLSGRAIL